MVLQGFLAGCFAQSRPLSFTCSITFEQSYGGVEGDSASLAELIAVLSDLAQRAGAAGPRHHRLGQPGRPTRRRSAARSTRSKASTASARPSRAGSPGPQGVIVPTANRAHLVLDDEVAAAVAAGRFHIYPVATRRRGGGAAAGHAGGRGRRVRAPIRPTVCSAGSPRGSPTSTASSPNGRAPVSLSRPRAARAWCGR